MAPQNSRRTPEGRPFPKGVSGNPGGRPKGLAEAVKAKVGKDGKKLVEALYAIALGTPKQIEDAFGRPLDVQVKDRREAVKELLDRGFGRPMQALELTGADGAPMAVTTIARVIVDGSDPSD